MYVPNSLSNTVDVLSQRTGRVLRQFATGALPQHVTPSWDLRTLWVSNDDANELTPIDPRTRRPLAKWRIPGPASPDMGGVSASGRVLWLSGRYDGEVYAISTRTGRLLHRIRVGSGPHGLCVWPQPGRYSIGHTGILR